MNEEGLPVTEVPQASSWFSAKLFDPPRLWCYRADVRVLEAFSGTVARGSQITVDLAYGVTRNFVAEFIALPYAKDLCAKGALVVLHLEKTQRSASAPAKPVYGLTVKPWGVDKGKDHQMIADMRIRMRRYEAMKEIDKLIAKADSLSDSERATLRELVAASRPGLGQPRWAPRERAYLNDVLAGSVPGKTSAQAWRNWWSEYRDQFIQLPFRIGGGLTTQPAAESRPG